MTESNFHSENSRLCAIAAPYEFIRIKHKKKQTTARFADEIERFLISFLQKHCSRAARVLPTQSEALEDVLLDGPKGRR